MIRSFRVQRILFMGCVGLQEKYNISAINRGYWSLWIRIRLSKKRQIRIRISPSIKTGSGSGFDPREIPGSGSDLIKSTLYLLYALWLIYDYFDYNFCREILIKKFDSSLILLLEGFWMIIWRPDPQPGYKLVNYPIKERYFIPEII